MTWTGWNASSTANIIINKSKAPRLEHKRGAFLFSTSTIAAGKPGVAEHMSKDKPGPGMALPRGADNRVAVDSIDDHRCRSCDSTSRLDRLMDRMASPEKPMHLPTRSGAESTRLPV